MNHNGGKSQINFNIIGTQSGEYVFANLIKSSTVALSGGANILVTPDICDSNGYIASFPSGVTSSQYSCAKPSGTNRPGNYDLAWTGSAAAQFNLISGGVTIISGSLTPSGGAGHVVISFNTATVTTFIFGFAGPASSIQLAHVNDLPALALNPNAFHPQFLAVNQSLKFGILRFLNWTGFNTGSVTTWASRRSKTYASFADFDYRQAYYGGVCTNSGSDYSVAASPSWTGIADKANISAILAAACPAQKTATFTNGSSSITATGHGLATGNQAYLTTTGAVPTNFSANATFPAQSYTTYFVTVLDANTVTLSATNGGTAIVAGSAGSGTQTLNPLPTLKVGSSAAAPFWNQFSLPYPQGFLSYPGANTSSYFIFDATFGAFVRSGSALSNGVPPEVQLDLCVQLGAHPWIPASVFTCDSMTDYIPSLCALIQTYQAGPAPWMVPRIEAVNEVWNTFSSVATQYAMAKAAAYGWGTTQPNNYNDWMGKIASAIGQACATAWGFGNKGVKYHCLAGVQTVTGSDQNFGTGSSVTRFNSATYIADPTPPQSGYVKEPAFKYLTHVCPANYFLPSEYSTNQEVTDAFNWMVTNAGNPTGQAAIAAAYVDTCGGAALRTNIAQVLIYFQNWVAFGQGVTHNQTTWAYLGTNYTFGVEPYEGGFSPDYNSASITSTISGATQDASGCVLTLASTSVQGSTRSGNPAVVGMYLKNASVGGMTQLNGNTYQVIGVGVADGLLANQVRINVDSSGFSAYTSGGASTYFLDASAATNMSGALNSLRGAGKLCTSSPNKANGLQGYLADLYNGLTSAGAIFPSCFQLGGTAPPGSPNGNDWSILEDVYQPLTTATQAGAIQLFNAHKRRILVKT